MSLSEPVAREQVNSRDLQLRGYRREDGLWDIEGCLTDRRSYEFKNPWLRLEPGAVLHRMWLRFTVDDRFVIHKVEAAMDATPFPSCSAAAGSYRRLEGLRIAPGWLREARERVGRVAGCTHLMEMLPSMATMTFQTVGPFRKRTPEGEAKQLEGMIDTCHGWRADGEAVRDRRAKLADMEA